MRQSSCKVPKDSRRSLTVWLLAFGDAARTFSSPRIRLDIKRWFHQPLKSILSHLISSIYMLHQGSRGTTMPVSGATDESKIQID
jgi:hypothetical protein